MSDLLAEIQSFIREQALPLEREVSSRARFASSSRNLEKTLRADVKKRGLWGSASAG